MTTAYLGLGSNLGRRARNLSAARRRLREKGARILRQGTVIETEPWGVLDQPRFLNQVLEVAEAAIDAGATMLNDVWALQRSPALADLAARRGCELVLMHNQDGTEYAGDLMDEIKRVLRAATDNAIAAGVPRERVLVDPGIGFGKTADHNWEVMRRLPELAELGQPILIGTSRKSFIGKLLDLPVTERVEGTAATVAAAILRGVDMVRVHDVRVMLRVAAVADRIAR